MRDRTKTLNLRVAEDERRKLHALAEDRDEPIAQLIRRFIREEYATRFGDAPPPRRRARRKPKTTAPEPTSTSPETTP